MKANKLNDKQMRELGFTDYRKGYWYYFEIIDRNRIRGVNFNTSFNLTINKKTLKCEIDVLDEAFLQPVKLNKEMKIKIEQIINNFKEKGVLYE